MPDLASDNRRLISPATSVGWNAPVLAAAPGVALRLGSVPPERQEYAAYWRLRADMVAVEQRSQAATEALRLRLTSRLGVMMGTAIAILGVILHLR
ncbi:MAG TPA: hypothetical protein VMB34_28630 [Acetobacteraceae bacterium]|nr:hypothetical protein [Acetobacteraceae bacterium]